MMQLVCGPISEFFREKEMTGKFFLRAMSFLNGKWPG
jgi:hypothetical protein